MVTAARGPGQGLPMCLNWRYRLPHHVKLPRCRRWNCPFHGWEERRQRVGRVLTRLPAGHAVTNWVHLNRRLSAKDVSAAVNDLRMLCQAEVPGARLVVFVHCERADEGLHPVIHLHLLLVMSGPMVEGPDWGRLNEIITFFYPPPARS